LSSAFNEYKKHFWLFIQVALVLYFIPTVILDSMFYVMTDLYSENLGTFMIDFLNSILSWLLQLLLTFTIIKILLIKRKREMSFSEALTAGTTHFGEGMAVSLIALFSLFGLFLLLIIPGLIFAVYWAFILYALITDNTTVTGAFAHSKKVVKGRWWTVFGYILFQAILIFALLFIIILPFATIGYIVGTVLNNQLIATLITNIPAILATMFITPFTLTFMEKFYLDLKRTQISS